MLCSTKRHCIQDSGLFTLMFGSRSGMSDKSIVGKWYDALVQYTLQHSQNATCVEVDCQKILGVEKAWEFRERMRRDLPNNRIINVFHIEDGNKGLDRLIEFSDYIAVSVPELRFAGKKNYVSRITRYIKSKKPSIDIHLLGCTEIKLLQENRFCTSADSSTWTFSRRYGFVKNHHISKIKTDKVRALVGDEAYNKMLEYGNEANVNSLVLTIEMLKQKYQVSAGNQDYKR